MKKLIADFKFESVENCSFKYRNTDIELKCKILTIVIEKAKPGLSMVLVLVLREIVMKLIL